jgi:TRAP-type C4-dicarboxylate transport system permease small subunit
MDITTAISSNKDLATSGLALFEAFIRYFNRIYQIMLVAAPILLLIYLMIGGIKYSASSGNHEKIQSAKKTIVAALTGCVITLLSYPFINLIGYFFTPPKSTAHVIDWYADLVTATALLYIAWGGIQYTTSSGNPQGILEVKRTITYAIQGYIWMLIVRLLLFP